MTDHLSLLDVQSILIHRSHVIYISTSYYVSVSTPVVAAKSKYVTIKVMLLFIQWYAKLYYVLPSGYISR